VKRFAPALVAGFLLLGLIPGTATATFAGAVDQSNTGLTNSTNSSQNLAQTFTSGKTGLLTGVSLHMRATSGSMAVALEPTTGGLPNDGVPVLATSDPGTPPSTADWVEFVFVTPTVVVAGTTYAIVFNMGALGGIPTVDSSADTYAGGQALLKGASWGPVNVAVGDFAFKTFVQPQTTTLGWDKAQIIGGVTTPLTLTETIVFPGLLDPQIDMIALPSWFTATGVVCTSQIAPADCILANVGAGGTMNVTPDDLTITVTITGHGSPLASADGTVGTASGQGCMIYTAAPVVRPAATLGTCVVGSANVAVVSVLGTPPPTATGGSETPAAPGSSLWLLPMALLALLASSLVVIRRWEQRVK